MAEHVEKQGSNVMADAEQGMKVALTILALAALPISAWLYIADYVEDRVDTAIERHDLQIQSEIDRQAIQIDGLRDYAINMCIFVRKADPDFSCVNNYSSSRRVRDR